jgi:hypothetical protein
MEREYLNRERLRDRPSHEVGAVLLEELPEHGTMASRCSEP